MDSSEETRVDVFVPTERMFEFKRQIDKIQSLARKLDLPEWEVTIGEKESRPVKVIYIEDITGRDFFKEMQLEGNSVTIVGRSPVLDGWQFLAKIEHDVGGNLVKQMVGGDDSPADWHTCPPNCNHCDVKRQRNDTYMLKHVETGDVKQVGSSCISDFLGAQYRDPARIVAMFDQLTQIGLDFDNDPDREGGTFGFASCGVEPVKLMAATLKIIQEDGGYISKEKGELGNYACTGDRLRSVFWSPEPSKLVPDVAHIEQAPQVLAWLSDQKNADSLWMRNIAYLADRQCVSCKDAGLLASGFVAWNRELQRKLQAERGSGDWIGTKGDKISTQVTLERMGGYDTQFGYKNVLSFRDEEGNSMIWKTTSMPRGLIVGSTYRVLATIKDHGEYKDDKQTEITRAKFAELELFSFGSLPGYKKMAAVATMDVMDESGHTPLLRAIWDDEIDHAKVLLAAGADACQLNQGEISLLSYAKTAKMAEILLVAGALATDVTDEWLKEMSAETRAVVVAAMPVLSLIDVVSEGVFSGRVMDISDGIITQKINRSGDTVKHDMSRLSATVHVDDVIDVLYNHFGLAEVAFSGKALEVGR